MISVYCAELDHAGCDGRVIIDNDVHLCACRCHETAVAA